MSFKKYVQKLARGDKAAVGRGRRQNAASGIANRLRVARQRGRHGRRPISGTSGRILTNHRAVLAVRAQPLQQRAVAGAGALLEVRRRSDWRPGHGRRQRGRSRIRRPRGGGANGGRSSEKRRRSVAGGHRTLIGQIGRGRSLDGRGQRGPFGWTLLAA